MLNLLYEKMFCNIIFFAEEVFDISKSDDEKSLQVAACILKRGGAVSYFEITFKQSLYNKCVIICN